MKKIETAFKGSTHTIPFVDVLFTESGTNSQGDPFLRVIFNGTTYNFENGDYNNNAVLQKQEASEFMTAWLTYQELVGAFISSEVCEISPVMGATELLSRIMVGYKIAATLAEQEGYETRYEQDKIFVDLLLSEK